MQCNATVNVRCIVEAESSLVGDDDGWFLLLSMLNALLSSISPGAALSISRTDGSMEVSNYYHLPPPYYCYYCYYYYYYYYYYCYYYNYYPPTIPSTEIL